MNRNRLLSCWALFVALLMLVPAGCHQQSTPAPPQSGLPTVQMNLGSDVYTLEVAADDYTRETGLMRRDSMPADHGMIFVFADEQATPFWMKDTRIPLDILFVAGSGKIISIRQMKPYDTSNTYSAGPYQYAIELNLNRASQSRVKEGDMLKLPTLKLPH